jgi:lipid A ethanolaminephosphotransferase
MLSTIKSFKLPNARVDSFWLVMLAAVWISLVANIPTLQSFWRAPSAGTGFSAFAFTLGGWLFTLLVVYGLLLTAACLFWGRSIKFALAVALIAASALSYFSMSFGTQFDKTMLINMLQTDTAETLELLNFRFLLWVVLAGVLPSLLIWRVTLVPEVSIVKRLVRPTLAFASIFAVCFAIVLSMYSKYASAARNRAINFSTVAPANIVSASASYLYGLRASSIVREARGEDAHQSYPLEKPRLFFLILGETARAKNHTLNGYERNTTPNMVARGGYYFPNTESCGTATAMSVPCMFSGYTRAEFSLEKGLSAETLFDVIARAGARAIWRDNDSGCKGICTKTEYEDFTDSDNPKWCTEKGQCFDEILLDGLDQKILKEKRDTIVVLHLKGSHGPAYYKRYPPAFEHFKPTCKTNDLSQCSSSELVNAYDNTIVYTDHIIGEVIKRAEELSKTYATAVLYVSDHGESLGEGGLFLHGLPYAIAPDEQTKVPMYAWVSPDFVRLEKWDRDCMSKQTKIRRSHDNVYSTVLGFLEIETVAYKAALDLFEPCDAEADERKKASQPVKK